MSKEYWIQCYECAIEDLMEDQDLNHENAELLLQNILDENSRYLDGYLIYDCE